MKKYKTFEDGTVKEVLARMLDEGFMPCSLKETWKQRENKTIPNVYYDTRTVFFRKNQECHNKGTKEH